MDQILFWHLHILKMVFHFFLKKVTMFFQIQGVWKQISKCLIFFICTNEVYIMEGVSLHFFAMAIFIGFMVVFWKGMICLMFCEIKIEEDQKKNSRTMKIQLKSNNETLTCASIKYSIFENILFAIYCTVCIK